MFFLRNRSLVSAAAFSLALSSWALASSHAAPMAKKAAPRVLSKLATLRLDAKSRVSIVLPRVAAKPEETAAQELDDYLTRVTGGDFSVVREGAPLSTQAKNQGAIYVGATQFAAKNGLVADKMPSEEWRIATRGKNLMLLGGGTRGTLYATYRFLEDYAGVRWWNPWEDGVPSRRVLSIPALNVKGKPSFAYRDIYMTYGHDSGRFAIRNRLNRDGDAPVDAKYGGSRDYGPPYHVHTLYFILPPDKYFAAHPEWYIGMPAGEKPTWQNSQLAMSNPEMRAEFLKNLKEIIRKSHADAKAKNLPLPDVFSVSQEDNIVKFETPADKELLAQNDGAESAILLNFINYLADGIKDEFPGVYIDTLAYYSGEKAPKTVRPRDNVIIRLTDTQSNLILPLENERNKFTRDNIIAWSKIAKNLRVWDYAVTYAYPGMPMPTAHTYAPDFRFMKAHNVEGVFIEHEFPILADMRDFKVWTMCKLLEDPNREYSELVKTFTDGFYGKAGEPIRRYIFALQNESERVGKKSSYQDMTWFATAQAFNYMGVDFVIRASSMFDEAERAAAGSPVLERRVRHARLPFDRYTTIFFSGLVTQWIQSGKSPETIPLDRDKIAQRYLKAWKEQADIRLPESERAKEYMTAEGEASKLARIPTNLPVPPKFADVPRANLFIYEPVSTRNYLDNAKVLPDTEAQTGLVTRLEISDDELEKYKLPMPWGIYDTEGKKGVFSNDIKPTDVSGPGYHWYKLGDVVLPNDRSYLYFFWSWYIQLDLNNAFDATHPDQSYEVWANIKFEGPAFPHGTAQQKNAISVERVVLVKK